MANLPFRDRGMSRVLIHPNSLIDEDVVIGDGTRIWAFAHIGSGAVIGTDCNICDHTFIEGRVILGNRVTLKSGVYLWDGVIVEDDVFIGPCAAFTNDFRPRSRQVPAYYPVTKLRQGCSIGAGAVVLPGLIIGRWSMIAGGSVVSKDVPDHALVLGSPARFRSWICRCGSDINFSDKRQAICSCGSKYYRVTETQIEETK